MRGGRPRKEDSDSADDTVAPAPLVASDEVADQPHFTRLFEELAQPLYGYLARRVSAAVAEDLMAETFLVAWETRSRYDPVRGSTRAWIYGIASNLLRRHHRDEQVALRAIASRLSVEGDEPGPEERVADRLDARVRAARLARGLETLSPGDRDVILLISWAGLDSTEVAAVLDIPVGTVRSRLYRVRRALRRGCGEPGSDDAGGGRHDDEAAPRRRLGLFRKKKNSA